MDHWENKNRREAAERYAASDKSDPFALARARTHMRNGVAGFLQNGQDAFYNADEASETVNMPGGTTMMDGSTSFQRTVYRSAVLP